MVQPPTAMPHPIKQHGLNQQYNQSVFQSTTSRNNDNQQSGPHSAANKMSHHSQDMHGGFYNQQMNYGGHQPFNNSNGAGSSNNFYQPFNNNMGHYSVSISTRMKSELM